MVLRGRLLFIRTLKLETAMETKSAYKNSTPVNLTLGNSAFKELAWGNYQSSDITPFRVMTYLSPKKGNRTTTTRPTR